MRESETRKTRSRPLCQRPFDKDGVLGQGARQAESTIQQLTIDGGCVRVRRGGVIERIDGDVVGSRRSCGDGWSRIERNRVREGWRSTR